MAGKGSDEWSRERIPVVEKRGKNPAVAGKKIKRGGKKGQHRLLGNDGLIRGFHPFPGICHVERMSESHPVNPE